MIIQSLSTPVLMSFECLVTGMGNVVSLDFQLNNTNIDDIEPRVDTLLYVRDFNTQYHRLVQKQLSSHECFI